MAPSTDFNKFQFLGYKEECYSLGCAEDYDIGYEKLLCVTFAVIIDDQNRRMEISVSNYVALIENDLCRAYKDQYGSRCIPIGCVENGWMEFECTNSLGNTYPARRIDPVCFSQQPPVECDGPFEICLEFDNAGRCIRCVKLDPKVELFDIWDSDGRESFLPPKLPFTDEDDSWLNPPNNGHSCLGGALLGCGTDDPDAAPSDSHRGKVLPPDIGGPSQIPSATVQRWVHRFLAMEDGKKDSRILPSGGPAPIDPAAPERPRRRKTLPPPPPYPADPRRIRPADPDEFSSGVAGQTIVTLAQKTFPDIFAGDQVMPSSAGPRPFDPISLEKRRGTMVPPQDWDPYGPRVRTDSMRLPDD